MKYLSLAAIMLLLPILCSCATYLERSDLNYVSRIPYDWQCIDRDHDGKPDGAQRTYPATRAETILIGSLVTKPRLESMLLPFAVIDLPISAVCDSLMYYFDNRSSKEYLECMKLYTVFPDRRLK